MPGGHRGTPAFLFIKMLRLPAAHMLVDYPAAAYSLRRGQVAPAVNTALRAIELLTLIILINLN